MKQKIILIISVCLLLILVGFMVKDLFFSKSSNINPYKFELDKVRSGDTTKAVYEETAQIKSSMDDIHGLAMDASGRMFVCGEGAVEIIDSAGKGVRKFPIDGNALSISLDERGYIYLGMEDHIEIRDESGKLLSRWVSCGTDAVITSIAVKGNDVFLADAGQKVVYHYDTRGDLIGKIGLKDPATGVPGFIVPSPYFDLAIGNDGFLWVANPGRHQLEKYDFSGKLLKTWGKATMAMPGFCGCCNPSNFAFIYDSLFVTSEKAIERVKIYNADGSFRCVVATPAQFEEGTKGLDLVVDKHNRIFVLDPVKRQIRIFELKKTT